MVPVLFNHTTIFWTKGLESCVILQEYLSSVCEPQFHTPGSVYVTERCAQIVREIVSFLIVLFTLVL